MAYITASQRLSLSTAMVARRFVVGDEALWRLNKRQANVKKMILTDRFVNVAVPQEIGAAGAAQ